MHDDDPATLTFDLVLTELIVELVGTGLLGRHDVARALLRAEYGAEVMDFASEDEAALSAAALRLVSERASDRLGLMPELHALRRDYGAWLREQKGPSPLEPERKRRQPRSRR